LAIIPAVAPDPRTHTWFILTDTLFGHGSLSEENRNEWKKTRGLDTALDDFFNVNAKTWLLQNKFTLPKSVQPPRNIPWLPAWGNLTLPNSYRLGTIDEIKAMSPIGGVIELSAVGFNADKTVAVVYMLGGKGTSFVLEKQNGKWKVSSALTLWVS
jgi:hypothetical protein